MSKRGAVEANLAITITEDKWAEDGDVYRYVYHGMNLASHNVGIVTPTSKVKENIMEIAKCMVVSEQDGDAIIFTAIAKKPTRTLEYKLQVIG